MYDNGRGVPQDVILAYMWFELSAQQGNESAVRSRDDISQRMSATQRADAQKLAREWKSGQ
jgi:TPR repeat protein